MKKQLSILLSAAALITLSSCTARTDDSAAVMASKLTAYEATVQALEDKLDALDAAHKQQKEENAAELNELREELEEVREEAKEDAQKPPASEDDREESETLGFKYIIADGCASITGYEGSEKKITVPSSVDGVRVSAIADGAFEGSDVTDVMISDGIESIGWFAFRGCSSLRSLTIPSSVKSIGYGALGEAQTSPFIYCHADSFALAYAKSYGLSYAVI